MTDWTEGRIPPTSYTEKLSSPTNFIEGDFLGDENKNFIVTEVGERILIFGLGDPDAVWGETHIPMTVWS